MGDFGLSFGYKKKLNERLSLGAEVKGYLSSRLAFITTVANKKKSDLESTLLLLSKENDEKKLLSAELYELKALRDTDVQIVRSRHMEDITKLRLDQLTALENEKAKCDIQVR